MEMPSRFRGILHPLNGTTGIAHCHLNWGENFRTLWNCNGRFHAERNQMMHLTNWSRQAGIPWSGRWWDSGRRRAASWRLAANLSQTLATRVPDLRQPADLPAAGSEGGGSWWLAGTHSLSAGQIDPTNSWKWTANQWPVNFDPIWFGKKNIFFLPQRPELSQNSSFSPSSPKFRHVTHD